MIILSQLEERKIQNYTSSIVDNIILLRKDDYTVNCYMKTNKVCFNKNIIIEDENEIYEAVIYNNKGGLAIYNVETKRLKNVDSLENILVLGFLLGKLNVEISLDQLIK